MLFSLIISTRGRVTELERLLDSLAQQSVQDFEVIIVDQNDDDRITYLASDARWRGRLFYLKSSEGVSRGRNDGLTRATGEIVTFPDDDCAYPPQLLENVAHFFQSQPRYGVLCGRSYDAEGGDAVALHSLKAEPVSRTKIYAQCIEFAIFIRRTALGETRFDENMGVGATTPWQADEGPDLVLRLQERGVLAYYDPQYGIWHPKRISAWDAGSISRSYRYSCGSGYFLRKHGYSFAYFLYLNARTLVGLGLACLCFQGGKMRFYWARIRGRWRGWNGYSPSPS